MNADRAAFIAANTVVQSPELLPEIKLHLASDDMPIWQMSDEEREAAGVPLPYWAFAWAGGQALARYLLDQPEAACGKKILDVGAGSGLEAIAAAMSRADAVTAADTDPFAVAATMLNMDLNGMVLDATTADFVGESGDWDLVMIGDLFFEQPLAGHLESWLRGLHRQGVEILIGDPQRTFLPRRGLEKLTSYAVPTTSALEDSDLRNASVWRMVDY